MQIYRFCFITFLMSEAFMWLLVSWYLPVWSLVVKDWRLCCSTQFICRYQLTFLLSSWPSSITSNRLLLILVPQALLPPPWSDLHLNIPFFGEYLGAECKKINGICLALVFELVRGDFVIPVCMCLSLCV